MKIHRFHSLVLIFILVVGVAMFFLTAGNTDLQTIVAIITSLSYIVWGIIHHALAGELHPKIVIEYILIGGIAIVLILTIVQ